MDGALCAYLCPAAYARFHGARNCWGGPPLRLRPLFDLCNYAPLFAAAPNRETPEVILRPPALGAAAENARPVTWALLVRLGALSARRNPLACSAAAHPAELVAAARLALLALAVSAALSAAALLPLPGARARAFAPF